MQDQSRPNWLVIGLAALMVIAVVLAVVGTIGVLRGPAEVAEGGVPSTLPRIVVSVDEQGTPSVFGVSLSEIGRLVGMDMTAYNFPAATVQQLMAANIQHAEVVIAKPGVFLFVNAEPLPYLSADDEAWNSLKQLLAAFQVPNRATIEWVLDNVVPRFGVQVAIKFPVQQGVAEIPLRDTDTLPQVDVAAQREAVTDRSLIAYADVDVDEAGGLTLSGVPLGSVQEGLAEANMAVDLSTARMDPGMVAMLTAANIQHLQLEVEPEGLYSYLNGKALPRVTWDEARLKNVVELYRSLDPASPYLPLADVLLPGIQPSDLEVTVHLPTPSDAEQVPTREFISP